MKWDKLGLVYGSANPGLDWAVSHSYIPTPIILDDDTIRVLVSFWDANQVGRLGYVDVEASNPTKIKDISKTPILDVGPKGTFDSRGITPMSYIKEKNQIYLFYTGWGEHETYPYTLFTGMAVSDDCGKTFTKMFHYPILPPYTEQDSIRTAAWISYDQSLDEYWMWYVGGKDWFYADNKLTPTYDLYLIRSESLFDWRHKLPTLCMKADVKNGEYAIGRPCVRYEKGRYKLYYSSRRYNHGYQLGYAESLDGYRWTRKDEQLGISKSQIGWDSEMQCFSYVLKTKHGTYMFYNGNEHGKYGFGVARLDENNNSG
jgi:predicted GH43/DUF377 family glycosyl hydrolase